MKTDKKTLAQLGEEYERNIKIQQYFIDKCRDDIKKAEQMGDKNAVCELKSKLFKFYEIKREMSETAEKLKNYYKGDDKLDNL